MKSTTEKLEQGSYIATIVASIVAAFSLGIGAWQFVKTQGMQQEALDLEYEVQAIALFNEYNKLQQEATDESLKASSEDNFWRENILFSLTESIYVLVGDQETWRETVRWMVLNNEPLIANNQYACDTINPEFIEFIRSIPVKFVCTE